METSQENTLALLTEAVQKFGLESQPPAKHAVKRWIEIHDVLRAMADMARIQVIDWAIQDGWTGFVQYTDDLYDALEDFK